MVVVQQLLRVLACSRRDGGLVEVEGIAQKTQQVRRQRLWCLRKRGDGVRYRLAAQPLPELGLAGQSELVPPYDRPALGRDLVAVDSHGHHRAGCRAIGQHL
jgi:hypothetical protein